MSEPFSQEPSHTACRTIPATADHGPQNASMKSVQVSVVIPAYKADYLSAAIDSALTQRFDAFEVLICDDCPDDRVARVVAPYLSNRRLRYLRNPTCLGEEGNVGECIRQAHGAYIKFLYDDDLLLPNCLARQATVFDAHPEVALVTARRNLIDCNGKLLPDIPATRPLFGHDTCVHGHDMVSLLAENTLNVIGEPSVVMVRRAQILSLAGRQFSLRGRKVSWLGDLTMYVQMMRQGHLAYIAEPLAQFRISAEQVSHAARGNPQIGAEFYAYFQRCIREFGWYRASGNRWVGARPLESRRDFTPIDLGQRLERMLHGQDPLPPAADALRPSADPMTTWLAARRPGPTRSRLIQARLDTAPRPSLAVFVIAAGTPAAAAATTLASLAGGAAAWLPKQLVLLETESATALPEPAPPLPPLQRVATPAEQLPATLDQQLRSCSCDWIVTLTAGDEFIPSGLAMAALEILAAPDLRALCADELIRTSAGSLSALLRPDFNLDLLLALPSLMARHWLFRREALLAAGGFDPAHADSPEFDLLLRLIDAGGLVGLGHISEPLLVTQPAQVRTRPAEIQALQRHLQHRGYTAARVEAALPGRYRIHYGHAARPGVSILIPTRNQLGMLQRCVESLLEKTAYKNYEVLIVDNGSDAADARAWLDGIEALASPQLRVLRYPQPFNYSAMNNLAARQARGEYLLLLNNDTAIVREDWLDALLNHAQRPEVGIVGAKLLYPDGRIQHAGVILGLHGPAEHPFIGTKLEAPGYMYRLQVDQDYSAVTGACLMVRKSVYEEVGGLDEAAFKVSYNDVDLCLKVHRAGYLVVWTPHAIVLHEGSVSQKQVDTAAAAAKAKRFQAEQNALYRRWLPAIAHDPAYNPNLSLNGAAFSVEAETDLLGQPLTRAPLPWHPLPVALALAADQTGCGHYRILEPARAMNDFGVADVRAWGRYFTPVEMERLAPDVVVLQRQMFADRIAPQQQLARFSRAFRVAELDDYLPKLPYKSAHRNALPRDILKTMRQALALVDRFVVSTDALAEACAGLHPDIRVVENHLPLPWWGDLQGRRRQGRKPRVGWAGGVGHRGDLELIADVVKALADEVDWVFFGMCPEALAPHVHEVIAGVAIDAYPRRLAALDLDLAVAPLEDNLFNQCKSNLRLLEYGACGFPVVCSDVHPYRCDLPVTRVKPRFKDWVEAIRMHVNDLDATAKAGDALRAAVHRDWMLDEKHARFWLSQWLPD